MGDGQIQYVLEHEVGAIEACFREAGMEGVKFTYVIVSKRINTRFFRMNGKPSNPFEESQEYRGVAHAQCLVYTLEGRAEPQLVHGGPLCTANHPVRLFSSKVRGLPYGPWAILGGIELFVFPILEQRDLGSL